MPAGTVSTDGQPHDLYAQASAARAQSELLAREFQATQRKAAENWQLIRDSWDKAEQICARREAARTNPDRLRNSAYARLHAQLASMPVIEQAKGIIMAKQGWSGEQAFDALRRASQRENVKVRDLAAIIVARTARSAPARRQASRRSTAAPSGGSELIPRVGSGSSRDRHRPST